MTRFQNETNPIRKRVMSWILVLALLLQTVIVAVAVLPMRVDALSAEANVANSYAQAGISYITSKNLSYYGDRTYKLSLTATSSIREAHETSVRTSSEDGYLTASADVAGYYLLEIYGGDGGAGASTKQGGEGRGGEGGYAYGYVWLDEGDTLVYTVGTIGESLVHAGEDGSGENNEDAGHGDNGSYAVGAGGGYSAIYLFRADENKNSTYVQPADGSVISEADRLSKYIMIAGGGGGGGAGNDALHPDTGHANGGAGGIVTNNSGIYITAEENAVNGGIAGTYYSGQNGDSSGNKLGFIDITSYDFVGVGGAFKPGVPKSTAFDIFDWRETAPAQYWYEGGTGGAGNYRGGGGGAGFAGGSGGIMTGAAEASNVGGGGGGSSFIAESVYTFPLDLEEDDPLNDLASLLQGPHANDNESGSGGKVVLTYLGLDYQNKAFTKHLEDVTINGTISEYFDILSVSVDNGAVDTAKATWDNNTNEITITGANITPDDLGYEDEDNSCRVDIIIRAKDNFFGGNSVPVLANNENFTLTTAYREYNYETQDPENPDLTMSGKKIFDPMTFYYAGDKDENGADYDDSADYCNVPLNLEASGNAYSYSVKNVPDPFLTPADLYNDIYTGYRSNMNQFASSCLETIGEYQVTLAGSSQVLTSLERPTSAGKWNYTVGYYVTSKVHEANAAIVGPVVKDNTFISDAAIIIVLEAGTVKVGDNYLTVDKLLSFDSDSGLYHLQVTLNGENSYNPEAWYAKYVYRDTGFDTNASQTDYTTATNRYVVPITGWYAIGVRGGQGGDGHGAEASTGSNEKAGGYGAFGDAVTGYVWLEKGDELTYYLGKDNCVFNRDHNDARCSLSKAGNGSGDRQDGSGGEGGEASWIAVQRQGTGTHIPLIIAAGGAGGAGARSRTGNRNDGRDWSDVDGRGHSHNNRNTWITTGLTQTTDSPKSPAEYNGGTGGRGYSDYNKPGTQPASYMNSNYVFQTLNGSNTVGKGDFTTTLDNPYFMDRDDSISGGYFPNALCSGGKGTGEFKVSGMSISLVYEAGENILIGTHWDANNSITSDVDVAARHVNSNGTWSWTGFDSVNNNATGKIANASSTDGYFDNLEFGIDFTKYFELVSFDYEGSTVTTSNFGEGTTTGSNAKLAYSVDKANEGATKVHLSNIDYDGSTYAYLNFDTGWNSWDARWNHTVNFKAILDGMTFDFYLKPSEGFVGGNDVPLLLMGDMKDDQDTEYAGIGITIPYDGVTRYVEEQDESDFANVAINYVFETDNFVTKQGIKMDCGAELDGIEDLIEENDDGTLKDIIPGPASGDEWKWDYAVAYNAREAYAKDVEADPSAKIGGTLFETTPYTLTQRIEPKYPDNADHTELKAVIVGEVSAAECDNHVTVTVVRPVEAKVINASIAYDTSVDGVETETSGDEENPTETVKVTTEADLSGTITADKGYILPDDITVYVCGKEMTTGYTYNGGALGSGAFTIPAAAVRELVADELDHQEGLEEHEHVIEIAAEATPDTSLILSFVWVDAKGEEHDTFDDSFIEYLKEASGAESVDVTLPTGSNSAKFATGDDLSQNTWFKEFLALDRFDLGNHKEFKWIWGTDDEQPFTEMPGVSTKVPGYVADKTYYVNVHFVAEDTTGPDLTEPIQVFGAFGSFKLVESPDIEGWIAKNASTIVNIEEDSEGNMIEDVYVEYVKAEGQLMVYHVKADTKEQLKVEDIKITDPGTESVSVMKVDHYTPYYDDQKVTGNTVDIEITNDDIVNGKTVYIYYRPDRFNLKFNSNSENGDVVFKANDKIKKTVEYNNSFGYDADDEKYVEFPQPERKGYKFLGWFTESDIKEGEVALAESTQINEYVDGDEDIDLYAHWEPIPYKVTINFTFIDKNGQKMETTNTYYPAGAEEQTYTEWSYESEYSSDIPSYTGFELTDVSRADGFPVENYAIRGTMPAVDLVYNVTYTQQVYTLTINFAWDEEVATEDRTTLPSTQTYSLVYGEEYSYTRAVLEGALSDALAEYYPYTIVGGAQIDLETLTGKMPSDDTAITVYYTDTPIESIELSWKHFEFTLNAEYDADAHDYIGNTITESDENTVTVINNSKQDVDVKFVYTPDADHEKYGLLKSSFAIDKGSQGGDRATVAGKDDATAKLSLSLEDGKGIPVYEELSSGKNSFVSGVVTVVIGDDADNGSQETE